jgi:hypothetical protein
MSRATIALGVGLVLLAVALALTLTGSPLVLAHANANPADEPILKATGHSGACQEGEVLPAGISAIRLILVAVVGPQVNVTVTSGNRLLAAGTTGSGWTAGAVTVPVKSLSHIVADTRICFKLGRSAEGVEVGGSKASGASAARSLDGRLLPGRFTVEYLHRGSSSWWSSAKTVSRRLGLGHAPAGTWIALFLIAAMGGVVASASWLVVKELG